MRDILKTKMKQRDEYIGRLLRVARSEKQITVSTCAQLLSTSRRRYSDIEQGKRPIAASELEAVMQFLEIAPEVVWGNISPSTSEVVTVFQGDKFRILVEMTCLHHESRERS